MVNELVNDVIDEREPAAYSIEEGEGSLWRRGLRPVPRESEGAVGTRGDMPVASAAWCNWQASIKRGVDITVATVLLILLIPLLLFIAIIIRLESTGPVIFRQIRLGRNGRRFTFLKFRGMTADAESRLHEVIALNEGVGPVFKIRRDPRMTRVGRIIRRTSLDELPQLWNVVKGEMSLVGPRPPIVAEVEKYESWQRNRFLVRPGITGLWQVSGRSRLTFDQMIDLDLCYIEHWSLWLDVTIMAKTIIAVLTCRGAY